jgi:F1F0 ATPase subunit 2
MHALVVAALVGLLLGGLYFGGLWWTVRHMPRARHPLTLYFSSLVVRLAVVLLAVYGVLTLRGWQPLVVALVAFTVVRLVLIRFLVRLPAGTVAPREVV